MLALSNPDAINDLVLGLTMDASAKFDLNRRMANRARQFFRQQIRAQRDIDGDPYVPRTRRKTALESAKKRGDMFTGLSRSLRTQVDKNGFAVGLQGLAGHIAKQHNQGATLSFTTKVNGYFDSRTGQWQGRSVKHHYSLPKRTFLGWTPALERELLGMIGQAITNQVSEIK